jgi:hypothetical protein
LEASEVAECWFQVEAENKPQLWEACFMTTTHQVPEAALQPPRNHSNMSSIFATPAIVLSASASDNPILVQIAHTASKCEVVPTASKVTALKTRKARTIKTKPVDGAAALAQSIVKLYSANLEEIVQNDRVSEYALILRNRNGPKLRKVLPDKDLVHLVIQKNATLCARKTAPYDKYNAEDHLLTCPMEFIGNPDRAEIVAYYLYNRNANLLRYATVNGERQRISEISYRVRSIRTLLGRFAEISDAVAFFRRLLSLCPYKSVNNGIDAYGNAIVGNKKAEFLDAMFYSILGNDAFARVIMELHSDAELESMIADQHFDADKSRFAKMILRERLHPLAVALDEVAPEIPLDVQNLIHGFCTAAINGKTPLCLSAMEQ